MIYMFAISGMVLGGQYLVADVFHFDLTSPVTNKPMKSTFLALVDYNKFQAIGENATTTQRDVFTQLCNGITGGTCSQVEWWGNLFFAVLNIMTGSAGIWDVLQFFGIPQLVENIVLIPYWILFFRAMLGYAKNFF